MSSSPFPRSIHKFMTARRYSPRTIKPYQYWIKYYINFNHIKHTKELDGIAVKQFLTYLAVNRSIPIATQAVALNALIFLYKNIIN
jgi:hypothetical protein